MEMRRLSIFLLLCYSILGSILFAKGSALVGKYEAAMKNKNKYTYSHARNFTQMEALDDLTAFAEALEKNTSVQELAFGSALWTEEAAEALSRALKKNRTVRVIKPLQVADPLLVVPSLVEALRVNQTITELDESLLTDYIASMESLDRKAEARAFKNKIDRELKTNKQIADLMKNPGMREKAQTLLMASGFKGGPESEFYKIPKELVLQILSLVTKKTLQDASSKP